MLDAIIMIIKAYVNVIIFNSHILNFADITAYNGPVGKFLNQKVWELPVGEFEAVPVEDFPTLDEKIVKRLSNDAKDLYRLCISVITGMDRIRYLFPRISILV